MNKLSATAVSSRPRYLKNVLRELKFVLSAMAIGSRTVPLADNRQLVRDLAARAACLYGSD
jgi:hypothetical protein